MPANCMRVCILMRQPLWVSAQRASLPEAKRPRSNAPTDDSDATIYFDSESPPVRAPTLRRPAASPLPRPDVKLAGVDMLCHDDIPTVVAGSLETMRRRELEYAPSPRFLDWHPGLSPGMRAVLVDWLMNVAFEFILKRETLHSAVNLMDRYLSKVRCCAGHVLPRRMWRAG